MIKYCKEVLTLYILISTIGVLFAEDNSVDETPVSLDSVTILGSDEEIERISGSAHKIDAEKLELHEYEDIHRVLAQVPGVYMRGEDGYGLRPNIGLRGANSDRSAKVTLMEDGILFAPAPYSAPAAYYFPMTSRLHSVEVFKGPASVKYGPHTIGGAINLVSTPIPYEKSGGLDLSYGLDHSMKLHAQYGNRYEKTGFLLEGLHLQTDGFKTLSNGADTGFDKNEFVARFELLSDVNSSRFQSLSFKFTYADEESEETYLGVSDADFASNPYQRYAGSQLDHMNWDRNSVHLQHFLSYNTHWNLKTDLYRHNFSRAWKKLNGFKRAPALKDIIENPTEGQSAIFFAILRGEQDSTISDQTLMIGTNARDFISQGLNSVFTYEFGSSVTHNLEAGFRYHQDEIERLHDEEGYLMTNGTPLRDTSAKQITTSNKGSADAITLHIHDEIRYEKLTVTPGLRIEKIKSEFNDFLNATKIEIDQDVLVPGLGFHYQLYQNIAVFGGVHKGFGPVPPQSQVADGEESDNFELGFRRNAGVSKFEAIAFYNDYSNLTAVGTFSQGFANTQLGQQFSGGEVNVWGLELLYNTEFKVDQPLSFPFSIAYTYTTSEFQTSFISTNPQFGTVTSGDSLAYVPEHQISINLGARSLRWEHGLSLRYVSEMRDTAGTGSITQLDKIDSYMVVDYVVSRVLKNGHKVYFRTENLLDEEYMTSRRPYGARPGKPLHFQLGYKFKF
jgi:Fe(3+) dicitrate transport protein